MSTGECGRHCLGKATVVREPSNEHDLYVIVVLENVGGGAAGGSGCVARLCTLKPKVSIRSGCGYRCGGVKAIYSNVGAETQQRHEELYVLVYPIF